MPRELARSARGPSASRPGGGALILVVLLALVIVLVLYFGNFGGGSYAGQIAQTRKSGRAMAVEMNTQQLVTLIAQYKLANNKLPGTPEDLDAPGAFRDPWGNPVTFTFSDAGGGRTNVTFRSAGPDGQDGTADDVNKTEPLPV